MLALLAGCIARGPWVEPDLTPQARRSVELDATPFFPQKDHQCGPAALATVLGASGVAVSADALTPLVYLPGRRGSLQVEMQAAPRQYGRLAYPLARNLDALLAELNAGRPVLVLHNYGVSVWPRWHYAVVVGYDSNADSLILRSGLTRRQVMSARHFMLAWENGRRWAMVLLKPGELPQNADSTVYLESAAAFERTATPADALLAFDAAVKAWPTESVAWVGRGTAAYRSGALRDAARDYATALRLDAANAGARNNLTMTLLELHCPSQARETFARLNGVDLPASLRAAVTDTQEQLSRISANSKTPDPELCASLH